MKIEQHEQALEEHLNQIERTIEEGVEENQRNVAYNISQGSVELFAMYLHKLHAIQGSGDQFDHRVFRSKNAVEKKIPFAFPHRKAILDIMKNIQDERNALCYGSRKPKSRIEEMIQLFRKLQKIIEDEQKE